MLYGGRGHIGTNEKKKKKKNKGERQKLKNVGQTIMTLDEDGEITFLTKVWEGRW